MESGRDPLNLRDEQTVLLARVHRVDEVAAGVRPERVEMEALADAMYAGVRATTAMDDDRGLEDARQAGLEFALNRNPPRLDLPADVVGAIVGDRREEALELRGEGFLGLGERHVRN